MKRLFIILSLLAIYLPAYSQNIYIDVKKNWYCQPPRLELDQLDTLVLTLDKPQDDPNKPLLLWQNGGGDKFQPIIIYNPTPGMQYIYPMEKWKIEQISPTDYKLTIKEGSRTRKYNIIQVRNNLLILEKMILVRRQ
jgi:hypothetical protein